MDPDACINIILRGAECGDYDRVAEACEHLRDWLRAGGFSPVVNRDTLATLLYLAGVGADHLDAHGA